MKDANLNAKNLAYYKAELSKGLDELYLESSLIIDRKNGLSLTVRALTTVLKKYVKNDYKRYARTTDDADMDYFDAVVTGVCDAILFVATVSEKHGEIHFFKNQIEELEKQMNHEN